MRRHLALRRTGAALTLPLVLALSSCASDNDEKADESSRESTSAKDTEQDQSKQATDGATPAPEADSGAQAALEAEPGETVSSKDFTALMEAAFARASTAKISMTTEGATAMAARGEVDYTTKTPSMQLAMTGGGAGEGQKIDVRLVDGAMYMSMGGMTGGKFVKFPLGDASNSPVDPAQLDPSRSLREFEKAAEKITYRGEEQIDGENLKRFTLVLNPTKMGNYDSEQLKTLPKKITYDVWFDGTSHFRQLRMGMGKVGTTTMKYSDWGQPVKISAPPADQVVEQPKMPSSPGGA